MVEKCTNCGNRPPVNKQGYLCPVCGDYFCFDCSEKLGDLSADNKEEGSPKCPSCEVFMNVFNPFRD